MQPALPGADKGHVAHPGTVRRTDIELTPQEIGRGLGRVVMFYCQPEAAFALCLYACLFA